jgi:hypothetical protein
MNLMFLASRTIGPVCAAAALAVLGVGGGPAFALEAAGSGATAGERLSFNEHIRPILAANCFACHGPDAAKRQAGLRLDTAESTTDNLDSGLRAIVPGDVAASELLARVNSDDPDLVMPPPEAKLGRLSAEQVDTLERWIADGAAYEKHWAFIPPPPPRVDDLADGIDVIVGEALAGRGLALQPEADRSTLLRRASFDLTGLPPTPQETAEFLADARPDAYERQLDRLLASPRYGERMAADWLDLARYADSYGFQVDRPRPTMWPWRDWVIEAFNDNLPWDQFTLWQIAGDLLPDATDEQLLATAFNRLHPQEAEGGSVEEEYRVAYVNDRVTTFGTAFLGLTLECCRCHDHKFDPLSQREYYSLFAFFDDVDEAGLYSFFTEATPTPKMRLADREATAALEEAEEACRLAAEGLAAAQAAARGNVADWLAGRAPSPALVTGPPTTRIPDEMVRYGFDERQPDGSFANALGEEHPATSPADNVLVPGRIGQAVRLTGDHAVTTPVGNFRRSRPFTVALWLRAASRHERAVVFHRSRAWTDAGSRGYELLLTDGHLRWSLIHFWPGDAASVQMRDPLPVDTWVHVAVTSDGSGRAAGLGVFLDGRPVATELVRDHLSREITGGGGDTIAIGERFRDHGFQGGLVDDFRVFDRRLTPLEIGQLVEPGAASAAFQAAAREPDGPAAEAVADFLIGLDPAVAKALGALEDARRSRDDLAERVTEIMVMRELPEPKAAYVLHRGEYDQRGEQVWPDTPAVLPAFPADAPRNRLGLARWLIEPEHPLLGRVTVNRVWQALFGGGLVETAEDFGSQAPTPEYPELLDLLAWSFSHPVSEGGLGWDLKGLIRSIMRSRAYRQRSSADPTTMADDPRNRWLARGPRHRLPAEMIRDGALAACGLLVERVGGPPVMTYDLPDSFKPEQAGTGEDLYRRSLYTYWRRTGPAPVLETFDVPNRVVCVARRDTTNTPLHALVLLNARQFVEAARVLAESLLIEQEGRAESALVAAFERLTSRTPDEQERAILGRMHADQLDWYRAHLEEADALLAVGQTRGDSGRPAVEVAALAAVINALLSYDGCVVKR